MNWRKLFGIKEIEEETINWKDRLNDDPTQGQFLESWKRTFEEDFNKCEYSCNFDNGTITVISDANYCLNGGFGEYVYNPLLSNKEDLYYEGCGCTWGIDLNGDRYHKLSSNGLPHDFDEVKDMHIIKTYLINKEYRERDESINELLR